MRVGYLFGVEPALVHVSWDARRDKPWVKVPSRLHTVLFTPGQQKKIIGDAIDAVLRQELRGLGDTTDLTDAQLTARLRALRG
jgi:hypothetical protein